MAEITAESAPADIKNALLLAAQDLREIKDNNDSMRQTFESANWNGLDRLQAAGDKIGSAYDSLNTIAEKFGLAAEVATAYLNNEMVGDKRTVTEAGQN